MAYPNAYYFLIEGNPALEPILKEMNCDYFIGLLSDSEKVVTFFVNKREPISTGNSIYREVSEFFTDDNILEIPLPTYKLDNIVPPNITFDFVKLDVQGSELDIMRGGMKTITAAKGVIMELSVVECNRGAPLEKEVIDFMTSIGFDGVEEVEQHFNSAGQIVQRDVLFINRNIEL